MQRWRSHHVTAIVLDVDARQGTVGRGQASGVREVQVAAEAAPGGWRPREFAVIALEGRQLPRPVLSFVGTMIEIDDGDAARCAGGDPDVRTAELVAPPTDDGRRVGGRPLRPAFDERRLAVRPIVDVESRRAGREDAQPTGGERERRVAKLDVSTANRRHATRVRLGDADHGLVSKALDRRQLREPDDLLAQAQHVRPPQAAELGFLLLGCLSGHWSLPR